MRQLLTVLLLLPGLALSQQSQPSGTLVIKGYPGQAPFIQVNGKSYVDLESLARLTNGSLSFKDKQTTLTLTAPANAAPTQSNTPAKPGLSKEFLRAGIEYMTVIREWRIGIVNAVKNNFPVADSWVSGYQRNATTGLALASTAVSTDSDRNALPLLNNEFANMQTMSDKYVAMHKSLTYISPDSLDGDPLDRQILECAHGLASLVASAQFQDVLACH